jgi:hypothetical protein
MSISDMEHDIVLLKIKITKLVFIQNNINAGTFKPVCRPFINSTK